MSKPFKAFPDISNKLQAPTKKSAFQQQKAEHEAKRARDAAETAKALKDFEESFEVDDEDFISSKVDSRPPTDTFAPPRAGLGAAGSLGPPKRHFAGSMRNSGPGSLGPVRPSLSRKRALDGSNVPGKGREQGFLAFENSGWDKGPFTTAAREFQEDEADDARDDDAAKEEAVPRLTVRLSNLPSDTSFHGIKNLFPTLKVTNVQTLPLPTSSSDRQSTTLIAIFERGTSAAEIDAAVSSLQKKYMGKGYYLDISRHLSTASLNQIPQVSTIQNSSTSSLPFGARPITTGNRPPPPPGPMRSNFAPPPSLNNQFGRQAPPVQVPVQPLTDIKQIRLIHKTVENVIKHGAKFEALLMSQPDVVKDEKWAWIWDARSPGGVYYRWRIWEILSGAYRGRHLRIGGQEQPPRLLFDGTAPWVGPKDPLMFEFATSIEDFYSDPDYNSSDDEDSDVEGPRQYNKGGAPIPEGGTMSSVAERTFLNPLEKAKLIWLLAGLPQTTGKLHKGDIAAVMDFAISHANRGIDEIVDILITNVEKPYSWSSANPDRKKDDDEEEEEQGGLGFEPKEKEKAKEKQSEEELSSAKLVGLYVISDVLSASSLAGVTGAWRYRSLFEAQLRQRKVFSYLGRLDRDLQWGRLKADKWKRAVNNILNLWDGWNCFDKESQKHLVDDFANPPLTEAETEAENKKAAEEAEARRLQALAQRKVESQQNLVRAKKKKHKSSKHRGIPRLDGADDSPDDGPADEVQAEDETEAMDTDQNDKKGEDVAPPKEDPVEVPGETAAARARRLRPKAEDMFADSDEG